MRTPRGHDHQILRKEFKVGLKVLLFDSRLKLIVGKLHSRWDGPFVITNVFSYGAVEIRHEASNKIFQVNGHQLKHFHEGPTLLLSEVSYKCGGGLETYESGLFEKWFLPSSTWVLRTIRADVKKKRKGVQKEGKEKKTKEAATMWVKGWKFEAGHSRSFGPAETDSKPKSEPNSQPAPALNLRNWICFGH
ncbi:hypothetical protein CR513_12002, partial [Mucuna pruriens]